MTLIPNFPVKLFLSEKCGCLYDGDSDDDKGDRRSSVSQED